MGGVRAPRDQGFGHGAQRDLAECVTTGDHSVATGQPPVGVTSDRPEWEVVAGAHVPDRGGWAGRRRRCVRTAGSGSAAVQGRGGSAARARGAPPALAWKILPGGLAPRGQTQEAHAGAAEASTLFTRSRTTWNSHRSPTSVAMVSASTDRRTWPLGSAGRVVGTGGRPARGGSCPAGPSATAWRRPDEASPTGAFLMAKRRVTREGWSGFTRVVSCRWRGPLPLTPSEVEAFSRG